MPHDCTSSGDIIPSRCRYIGPIGDLTIAFQVGRHLVEGENLVAAAACSDVSPTGTSVAGASPSWAKPSRIAAGILLSTAMPRETAITGRPCSLAMRLKCAAAIWLLTEPWRHTKTNVAGLLESSSARLTAPIKTVIRRSIKLPMRASDWDLGDALPSMCFGSTTPP